ATAHRISITHHLSHVAVPGTIARDLATAAASLNRAPNSPGPTHRYRRRRNSSTGYKTDLSEFHVIELDETNALVTYRPHLVAEVQGDQVGFSSDATGVYTRVGDAWRSVFHQQTAL